MFIIPTTVCIPFSCKMISIFLQLHDEFFILSIVLLQLSLNYLKSHYELLFYIIVKKIGVTQFNLESKLNNKTIDKLTLKLWK